MHKADSHVTAVPASSAAASSLNDHVAASDDFRAELLAVWNRIGRPKPWAMAERTGKPSARFQFLGERAGAGLPDWDDVEAFLAAARQPRAAVAQWKQRWDELDAWTRTARRPAQSSMITGCSERIDRDGILGRALAAETRDDFVECLRELKQSRGISFATIEERTAGQLPKSTAHWIVQPGNFPTLVDQISHFVTACGANEAEAALWTQAWTRAQFLQPPVDYVDGDDCANVRLHKSLAAHAASDGRFEEAYRHTQLALELLERERVWVVPFEELLGVG